MSAPTILRVRGNEECSQAGLLKGILRCLLQPSVPLSAQAAVKLHHQQQQWPGTRASAGRLLKSLPVELLYDNTGLALFDQVGLNGASSLCCPTYTLTNSSRWLPRSRT